MSDSDKTKDYKDDLNFKIPKVLILPPGGVQGFLTLGSLKFLVDVGYLDEVDTIIGCSIGSII